MKTKMRSSLFRTPALQRGVGLLEVLIAVLVMAIGLLGIAALQATALRNSQSSMERSQAVVQTYAILDAMRANPDAAKAGGYNYAVSSACAAPGGGTLAGNDLATWLAAVKSGMGSSACGGVACDAAMCTVTVQWDDSRASASTADAATDKTQTVQTRSRL